MVACLFTDDTVLFTESEELLSVVDEFYSVCTISGSGWVWARVRRGWESLGYRSERSE